MKSFNDTLFFSLNSLAGENHFLDLFMILIAKFTPYAFISILLYLWFTKKQIEALYSGYAATLGIIINQIIGLFYFHSRPFMDHVGLTLLEHKAENSFPSDHTTFTLSIALILINFKNTKLLGIITFIFAIWCGIARIYCGVHYPLDIIGSIIVAIITITVIKLLSSKLNNLSILIITLYNNILGTINDGNN